MATPDSIRSVLLAHFDALVVARAEACIDAQRAHLVKPPPWPVVARVRAASGGVGPGATSDAAEHVVTVLYDAGSQYLKGECSCGPARACVHAAAAALLALRLEATHTAENQAKAQHEVVASWLASLGRHEGGGDVLPGAGAHVDDGPSVRAGAGATAPRGVLPDRAVLYVLGERDGRLGLRLMQAVPLARGGWGAMAALGVSGEAARGVPAWVSQGDARRVLLLRVVAHAELTATELAVDRISAELWCELCATGRLMWHSTMTPLRYAEARSDRLAWLPMPGQPQLHRLFPAAAAREKTSLVVVPAQTCHFVDPASGVMGPLELGLAAEVVARLLSGPPVPTAMLATAMHSTRALLGNAGAPDAPKAATSADSGAVAFTPRVKVSIAELELEVATHVKVRGTSRRRSGRSKPSIVRLSGEAIYSSGVVPLGQWDAAHPMPRDLAAEQAHAQTLQRWAARMPHGGTPANNLQLLAEARFVVDQIVPALRAGGWSCVIDESVPFEAPVTNVQWYEAIVPITRGGDGGYDNRPDWFSLELGVTIAGRTVPLLPILLQAIASGQLVIETGGGVAPMPAGVHLRLPEGESVYVPGERLQRWLRPLVELQLFGTNKRGELIIPGLIAAQLQFGTSEAMDPPGEDELVPRPREARPDQPLDRAAQQLASLVELAPAPPSPGFTGELRTYQRRGVAWLLALHRAGYGGILADEMGLGKTVQVLAFLADVRPARASHAPALVVAPRSVVDNWAQEAARFVPGMRCVVHLGGSRATHPEALAGAEMVVTSYQTMLRDAALLVPMAWSTLIFDEAQALKNPEAQLRKVAAKLRAQSRFCVTGTPMENHLGELWAHADLVVPGILGRRVNFAAVFRRAIEKRGDQDRLEVLRQRMRPFLLRRRKVEVELDLPPKTEIAEYIALDTAQRDLYESLRLKLDVRVQRALKQKGIQGSALTILDALLKLRQCCCDPRLIKIPEAQRVMAAAGGAEAKVAGGVVGSAKLERLVDMLVQLADSGRKTLVFSQFTSMLALIEAQVRALGIRYSKLTGQTRDRAGAVAAFQTGEAAVMLVSLKAGGTGLNLTAADTVIHYDPWWNPAVMAQATDRAHRIGQTKSVMVYKLIARGTLEEAIYKLGSDKQALADAALADGGAESLAPEDLLGLYRQIA